MASIPLLIEDNVERRRSLIRRSPINHPSINRPSLNQAFSVVAQEVMDLLKQDHHDHMSDDLAETIMIRAVEPEYRRILDIEPLTAREREVLQLIVDGFSNHMISESLYVTVGTVKTHIRHILKKLYVSDRTQAAILALRAGLAH